jgi:membrane protease YdiL (CAAX protease family)
MEASESPGQPPRGATPHRAWPVLLAALVVFFSGVLFLTASGVALLMAGWFVEAPDAENLEQRLTVILRTRWALSLSIALPQFALLLMPLVAAAFLRGSVTERLGLYWPSWPWWAVAGAIAATPLIGLLGNLLVLPFFEESESLRQMAEAFRYHGRSGFFIALLVLVGVLPAICEEVLFRGFLQRYLCTAAPAWLAILLASLLFAAFHLDPVHVVAVIPLGLWLGWLTHASGSLIPACLAHLANNVLSVSLTVASDDGMLELPSAWWLTCMLIAGIAGVIAVVAAARPKETAIG